MLVSNHCLIQVNFLNFATMKIFIIAATKFEIQPSIAKSGNGNTSFFITGIGMLATAVSLTKIILQQQPDLVIQAGIAGSYNNQISLGKVVVVKQEFLGDTGVEEAGIWKDIFDLNLIGDNDFPFVKKQIINPYLPKLSFLQLDEVIGVTVNEISTNQQRIKQLISKYNPIIESMEGAAMHYVCTDLQVPYLQIRSISNYVGERDKIKWKMLLAIANLNDTLVNIVNRLCGENELF